MKAALPAKREGIELHTADGLRLVGEQRHLWVGYADEMLSAIVARVVPTPGPPLR